MKRAATTSEAARARLHAIVDRLTLEAIDDVDTMLAAAFDGSGGRIRFVRTADDLLLVHLALLHIGVDHAYTVDGIAVTTSGGIGLAVYIADHAVVLRS